MYTWRKESWLDIYKLAIGAFLLLAPWLFAFSYMPARVDALVCGLFVSGLSVMALFTPTDWEQWAALVLGLWISVSPWVLGFPHAVALKINILTGLLTFYLAGLELFLTHYETDESP